MHDLACKGWFVLGLYKLWVSFSINPPHFHNSMHIGHSSLHISYATDHENLFNNQGHLEWMVISYILITLVFD